jgi:CRP/FNR family transcriptional regulator
MAPVITFAEQGKAKLRSGQPLGDTTVSQVRRTTSYAQLLELLRFNMPPQFQREATVFQHLRLRRGQKAFQPGQSFNSLLAVRSGFLKMVCADEWGEEKVQSFPMKGDLIGTDGFHGRKHRSEAIALSDCELVIVPFLQLQELSRGCPELELAIYAFLSRDLCEERTMNVMLAKLGAEARVARFLLATSGRYASLGFSPKSFELRMTRSDIANYLGLSVETVSRTLTALEKLQYISVDNRLITILAPEALGELRRLTASVACVRAAGPILVQRQ